MSSFEQRAAERRRSMTAYVARSKDEARRYTETLDRAMSPVERVEAIWGLTWDLLEIGGHGGAQRRLDRSVARLEHGRR